MLPHAKLNTLPNGFRIVTVPMRESEMVTVMVAVRVGARAETPKQRGIAHFVEHLAFKGSQRYPKATDFDDGVAEIGGYSNASTNMEYTYYIIQAPKDKGSEALDLVAEMAAFSRLPEDDMVQESRVVAEEILRHQQDEEAYVEILFEDLIYQHQPLGWEIAGTAETVAALSRKDVVAFREKWYCPNAMVAVIMGGGDLNALTRQAGEKFRVLKRKPTPTWKPYVRTAARKRVAHVKRGKDLVSFEVGVPGLPASSHMTAAQRLLDEVMGGDTASRLHERIREREGLVYVISNVSEFYSDAGHTATATTASVENAPIVLEHILDEHRRIVVDPVTEHELRHAKATGLASVAALAENQEDLAVLYFKSVLFRGYLRQIADVKKSIQKVDLSSVRSLADKLYRQQPFLASVGPKPLVLPKFKTTK